MMRHSFTVGGVDMRERFGLIVEGFDDLLLPALRPRKAGIPERDGAYDFGAKYYDERKLVVRCASPRLSISDCEELAGALSQKTRIVRWDKPDRYYLGRIYDETAMERIAAGAKRFSLSFVCEPFTYGERISEQMPPQIDYRGTAPTATYIRITNRGGTAIRSVQMTIRKEIRS